MKTYDVFLEVDLGCENGLLCKMPFVKKITEYLSIKVINNISMLGLTKLLEE